MQAYHHVLPFSNTPRRHFWLNLERGLLLHDLANKLWTALQQKSMLV